MFYKALKSNRNYKSIGLCNRSKCNFNYC